MLQHRMEQLSQVLVRPKVCCAEGYLCKYCGAAELSWKGKLILEMPFQVDFKERLNPN